MPFKVVIQLQNPNALISMALVSENSNNPFYTFCEYIKYCIYSNASEIMTLEEIRDSVGLEFGVFLPRNIELQCISFLCNEKTISATDHTIKRIGSFDTAQFDELRNQYRRTENALISAFVKYLSKLGKTWEKEYAREKLISVLDGNGLAFDIFTKQLQTAESSMKSDSIDILSSSLFPDDEEGESDESDNQPLYSDNYYVGKYIQSILSGNSIEKEYLHKICEGLMICAGVYQLPSTQSHSSSPQIKGTEFFFDTKLLLRFVGCAGAAAVESAKELVKMIQNSGGKIFFYPHTLEEIYSAFDDAIKNLGQGFPPKDNEMRLYSSGVKNSISVISAKKAGLIAELQKSNIYLRELCVFSDDERIRYGFSKDDLEQFMKVNLHWRSKVIENDAVSIWETHMRRKGNYRDYCGTSDQIPVFVTTNPRLIEITLKYKEHRKSTPTINSWGKNRLPVITDVRLTCRLWSPSSQGDRLSMLYLTSNVIAAQRPTQRYINKIRELAVELGEQVSAYSSINLTEYFDDQISDSIFQATQGEDKNLNIGTFTTTIAELTEWKAKEQEDITSQVKKERDRAECKLEKQKEQIIEGAIERNKNKLGINRLWLLFVCGWHWFVTILFSGISALVSYLCGNWLLLWAICVPVVVTCVESFSKSKYLTKKMAKAILPKIEESIESYIVSHLGNVEFEYKDTIISQIKNESALLVKCRKYLDE